MNFSQLPHELFDSIVAFLDAEQVAHLSATCTRIYQSLYQHRRILNALLQKSIFNDTDLLNLVYSKQAYSKYVFRVSNSKDFNSATNKVLSFPDFSTFYSSYTNFLDSHPNMQNAIVYDPTFNFGRDSWYGFSMACFLGFDLIVEKMLKDTDIDPSDRGDEAIRLAALNGHVAIVKLLLSDSRVNPCARDNCAFRWAASKGHAEVVVLLLSDPRIDPAAGRNSALKRASQNRNWHLMKLLSKDHRVDFYTISFIDRMRVRLGMIVNKV